MKKESTDIITSIVTIFALVMCCVVSWLLECGLIKLIAICYGWNFSWFVATGIWLISGLLCLVFTIRIV